MNNNFERERDEFNQSKSETDTNSFDLHKVEKLEKLDLADFAKSEKGVEPCQNSNHQSH